jgi:hypothetical protein
VLVGVAGQREYARAQAEAHMRYLDDKNRRIAFGRGYESGEGERGTGNDRVKHKTSFDLRKCQLAGHLVSKYGQGGVKNSPMFVS